MAVKISIHELITSSLTVNKLIANVRKVRGAINIKGSNHTKTYCPFYGNTRSKQWNYGRYLGRLHFWASGTTFSHRMHIRHSTRPKTVDVCKYREKNLKTGLRRVQNAGYQDIFGAN